jgi:lipopolysaccharide transport system permease protein
MLRQMAHSVTSPDPSVRRVVLIEPPRGLSSLGLGEVWGHRELMYFLAWRDVKVRYKQAALGVAWAVLQPLLMMVIFTIFLGRVARLPSEGIAYPLFVLSGLVPWTFFANAVSNAANSLVANANLVSKVYFPRLVMPVSALIAWLPDLGIALLLLVAFMAIYGVAPAWTALLIPLFIVLMLLAAFSIGVWFSALNVAYRDVRYAIPFLIQIWLFATPVVYPASAVPETLRIVLGLNPMTGVVEGFRWALFGGSPPSTAMLLASLGVTLLVLASGLVYFRRVEHYFADVI